MDSDSQLVDRQCAALTTGVSRSKFLGYILWQYSYCSDFTTLATEVSIIARNAVLRRCSKKKSIRPGLKVFLITQKLMSLNPVGRRIESAFRKYYFRMM